jgi:hypothetical protein
VHPEGVQGVVVPELPLEPDGQVADGGGRFRFRGGDPAAVANRLESLLKKQIPGKPLKVARL